MQAKYPKLHNKKWLSRVVQDQPLRQIASEVGCSYSAVQYAVKKFGITVPWKTTYNVTVDKSKLSKEAYKRTYPNGRFGELAANWRGGRVKTGGGHIYKYAPDHPYANKKGYVMEHRLVMEEKLGRYLKPTEIVHHINGDKQDNRPENLHLHQSRAEHVQHHFDAVKEVARLKELLDKHNIDY